MPHHNHNLVLRNDQTKAGRSHSKISKEAINLFQNCPKFSVNAKHENRQLKENQAIVFLKLRSQQCKRHDAIIFSQRHLCKWDSTTTKDGPASCRILNPKPIHQAMISGWQNAGEAVLYDEGLEYETDTKKICLEDSQDKLIQEEFNKNEAKIQNDFKAKIKNLQNFYQEINEKYNFDIKKLGFKGLKESLQQINQVYRDSREKPLKYMKYQGIRFLHIMDEFPTEEEKGMMKSGSRQASGHNIWSFQKTSNPETAIEEMNAFQKLANVKRNQFKMKEKFADDLFFHLNTKPLGETDGQTQLFNKMEEQSRAMMKMANIKSEGLAMTAREPNQDDDEESQAGVQAPDLFAQDFNNSQYMFKVKEVNSLSKQLRLNKIKKIMDRIDEQSSPMSPQKNKDPFDDTSDISKSQLQNPFSFHPHSISNQSSAQRPFQISPQGHHLASLHHRNQKSQGASLKSKSKLKEISISTLSDMNEVVGSRTLVLDREQKFQLKMKGFIKKNIEKMNTPYQMNSIVSTSNLEVLIKARGLETTRERSKIQQPTQSYQKYQKIKGKLSLNLFKGKNIFLDGESLAASSARQLKYLSPEQSPEQIRKLQRIQNNLHLKKKSMIQQFNLEQI